MTDKNKPTQEAITSRMEQAFARREAALDIHASAITAADPATKTRTARTAPYITLSVVRGDTVEHDSKEAALTHAQAEANTTGMSVDVRHRVAGGVNRRGQPRRSFYRSICNVHPLPGCRNPTYYGAA